MNTYRLVYLVSFLAIGFILFAFRPLGGVLDLIFGFLWLAAFIWWVINAIRNYIKYNKKSE